MKVRIDADDKGVQLRFGPESLVELKKIGLGPHVKAVLDQRQNMLVLTTALAAETVAKAHLNDPIWAQIEHDRRAGSLVIRFRRVLAPVDWGSYEMEFMIGTFLALGELPDENRDHLIH